VDVLEISRLSRSGIGPGDIRSRPLFYLHLPKTGGTSFTDAIVQLYGYSRIFGQNGDITIEYLSSLGDRLSGSVFIAGHPGRGIVPWLGGRADIFTILRKPIDHAVSNYLHIAEQADHPLRGEANELDLASFLRRNPAQAHLQAAVLARALSPPDRTLDTTNREDLRTIQQFVADLPFAGVLDDPAACCAGLGRLLGLDRPLEVSMLNSAACRGVRSETVERLRASYRDAQSDPQLAPYFAAERLLYRTASRSLARVRAAIPMTAMSAEPSDRQFAARTFFSMSGAMEGGQLICDVPPQPVTLVYGPYQQLAAGRYRIEFQVSPRAGIPRRGVRIRLQVFANGRQSVAARRVRLGRRTSPRHLRLRFDNPDPGSVLEFRIRSLGDPGGAIAFEGVRVTKDERAGEILADLRDGFVAMVMAAAGRLGRLLRHAPAEPSDRTTGSDSRSVA
jgi:hypothetical protein